MQELEKSNRDILELWRQNAVRMVDDPDIELGLDPANTQQTRDHLRELIRTHSVEACHLVIHAIGTVFLHLDFAGGIPLPLLQGFTKCWEFAAYCVAVSDALLEVARQRAEADAGGRGEGLKKLSRRPPPVIQRDPSGKEESRLFTAFTPVALCIDDDDDVDAIKKRLLPGQKFENALLFEYHGLLHFSWAACVLQSRSLEPAAPSLGRAARLAEMDRMRYCIQLAHVFLGTCEAFEKLFVHETMRQAGSYVKGDEGRDPQELNRLRTLALAVIGLTRFQTTAATDEDLSYFDQFEKHARLQERHRLLQEQCGLLHNVQEAETQVREADRQKVLNAVVLFLTAFTFLSVLADSYAFVRGEEQWLPIWLHRFVVWGSLFVFILLAGVFIIRKVFSRRLS